MLRVEVCAGRVFNIYLISTKGVLPGKDIDRCLQCAPPCEHYSVGAWWTASALF